MTRPDFIRHWEDLEDPVEGHYPGDTERMSIGAALGQKLGLTRLGIHHERLRPGRRTSYPHAESDQDEFVFVLQGTPDVWIDGHLHRLQPGDSVAFPAGTGISHSFLNNTEHEARLLVVGEANRDENKIHYPRNEAYEATISYGWKDCPARNLGPHDGKPRIIKTDTDPT
jgi:uncharacterized cupin superfamily protein